MRSTALEVHVEDVPPCTGSADPECRPSTIEYGRHAHHCSADSSPVSRVRLVRASLFGLAHSGQPCLHPGGDGRSTLVQERCHDRVAVLGSQLMMRRGRAAVIWGYRRRIHTARLALQQLDRAGGDVAGHHPGRRVAVVRRLDQVGELESRRRIWPPICSVSEWLYSIGPSP